MKQGIHETSGRKVHRAGNPLAEVDVHIRICHTGW